MFLIETVFLMWSHWRGRLLDIWYIMTSSHHCDKMWGAAWWTGWIMIINHDQNITGTVVKVTCCFKMVDTITHEKSKVHRQNLKVHIIWPILGCIVSRRATAFYVHDKAVHNSEVNMLCDFGLCKLLAGMAACNTHLRLQIEQQVDAWPAVQGATHCTPSHGSCTRPPHCSRHWCITHCRHYNLWWDTQASQVLELVWPMTALMDDGIHHGRRWVYGERAKQCCSQAVCGCRVGNVRVNTIIMLNTKLLHTMSRLSHCCMMHCYAWAL